MSAAQLVVSCEHGGRRVPARYRAAFSGAGRALASHRGEDAGALVLARQLARRFGAPLLACTTTRLLVDANRSLEHPRVLSEWTRRLPRGEREAIVERYWCPHRAAVEAAVRAAIAREGCAVHLSLHSFTPRWEGRVRRVDVGFLFDPARPLERELVDRWLAALAARRPDLRLRRNLPYRGTSDGLTTTLRGRFPADRYVGLELEVSQRFPRGARAPWARLRREIGDALAEALAEPAGGRRWPAAQGE